MANRQRAEARRKAQAKAARQSGEGGGSLTWLWIAIGVVIVLVGGIVLFAGGDEATTADGSVATSPFEGLPDSQPVTITGDPLPAYDSSAATDPAVGTKAPVLSGLDFGGGTITADSSKDGAYMLVFLAHWCPHCNAEIPMLRDWKQSGGVPDDLKVIGVATAVSETSVNYPPAQWFSDRGWSWPVMVDESVSEGGAGKAAIAYGASGWPYFVIVGADGNVKVRVSGEIGIADLQAVVDAALAS